MLKPKLGEAAQYDQKCFVGPRPPKNMKLESCAFERRHTRHYSQGLTISLSVGGVSGSKAGGSP